MVTNAGQVFDTAPPDENDGVFLEVMAFVGDIGDDLLSVGQADLGDFAHGGIGLLRGTGHDLDTNAPAERGIFQGRRLGFRFKFAAALADQLINCWHFA